MTLQASKHSGSISTTTTSVEVRGSTSQPFWSCSYHTVAAWSAAVYVRRYSVRQCESQVLHCAHLNICGAARCNVISPSLPLSMLSGAVHERPGMGIALNRCLLQAKLRWIRGGRLRFSTSFVQKHFSVSLEMATTGVPLKNNDFQRQQKTGIRSEWAHRREISSTVSQKRELCFSSIRADIDICWRTAEENPHHYAVLHN